MKQMIRRQFSTIAQPGVSIIICCYNAQDRIVRTLEHIQRQKFSTPIPWEVIVIDNASTDDTAVIAENQWNRHPVTDFKICYEGTPGLNHARSRGFREARYDILSLVDDDNWLESHWVEKVYQIFQEHKNVGACSGQNIPAFDSEPPTWFNQFKHSYATGQLHFNEGIVNRHTFGNLWGAGLSIRSDVITTLERIGFKFVTSDRKGKSLSCGGDTELCYAIRLLGYDLYYTNNLVLHHFVPSYRLQWNYVKGLNYEFGKLHASAEPYFDLYHKKPKRIWWKNLRNALILYIYYQLLRQVQTTQKGKWKYTIKTLWWKGKVDQLWQDKGGKAARNNYQQLHNTFKNPLQQPQQKENTSAGLGCAVDCT